MTLLAFNISLTSTRTSTSAQFHPCVRTQTARSRGRSSSWSSQPCFRQAVAWGAGQDGWQGVLPPPSHCFIQFLRNLGLWVVGYKKHVLMLEFLSILFPLTVKHISLSPLLFLSSGKIGTKRGGMALVLVSTWWNWWRGIFCVI